ncbi:hypothetical protein AAKU61_004539 [Undibacterium sp. GrIS 1.2]|uniref:hypothetical protein n=1 Tax=Undibacterium sp. GrIS 1.2 TaxID=3143933 RepID=UPI00339A9050
MKIASQSVVELTHCAKLIDNIQIAILTTLDDDGAVRALSGVDTRFLVVEMPIRPDLICPVWLSSFQSPNH